MGYIGVLRKSLCLITSRIRRKVVESESTRVNRQKNRRPCWQSVARSPRESTLPAKTWNTNATFHNFFKSRVHGQCQYSFFLLMCIGSTSHVMLWIMWITVVLQSTIDRFFVFLHFIRMGNFDRTSWFYTIFKMVSLI